MNKKIIAVCAVAGLLAGCSATPQFENSKDMEDVVGMELPSYKMKKYIEDSSMDIHGDYDDSLIVEFDCLPSKAFIEKVNKMVEQDSGKTEKRFKKIGCFLIRLTLPPKDRLTACDLIRSLES